MYPLRIKEDKVIGKLLAKQLFIMDAIEMVVYELFLYGSVVSLNIGVNLWTSGIGEEMRDSILL